MERKLRGQTWRSRWLSQSLKTRKRKKGSNRDKWVDDHKGGKKTIMAVVVEAAAEWVCVGDVAVMTAVVTIVIMVMDMAMMTIMVMMITTVAMKIPIMMATMVVMATGKTMADMEVATVKADLVVVVIVAVVLSQHHVAVVVIRCVVATWAIQGVKEEVVVVVQG